MSDRRMSQTCVHVHAYVDDPRGQKTPNNACRWDSGGVGSRLFEVKPTGVILSYIVENNELCMLQTLWRSYAEQLIIKQKAPGFLRRLQLLSVNKWIITLCKSCLSVSFDFYWLSHAGHGYMSHIWTTRGYKSLRSSAFSTSDLL